MKIYFKISFLIFISSLLLYSIGLGNVALLDPNEPVYGEVAREMVETNKWLTPHYNNQLWFDKPPLYYWLTAISFKIFGINEFAARFPSVFFASLLLVLIYIWIRNFYNDNLALYTIFILATSLFYFVIARSAVTDMTLTFFLNISFFFAYLLIINPFDRKYLYYFYFFMALATLVKGPIGLIIPILVIIFYLLINKQFKLIRIFLSPVGILIFLLVSGSWYFLMLFLHGKQFFNTFIGYHNFIRYLEPEHIKTSKFYFFVPVLFLGFFPHLFLSSIFFTKLINFIYNLKSKVINFLINIKSSEGKKMSNNIEQDNINEFNLFTFFITISVTIFLFFSISKTKLVTYILPMFPSFAIILAKLFLEYEKSKLNILINFLYTLLISGALIYGVYVLLPLKLTLDFKIINLLCFILIFICITNLLLSLSSKKYLFYINGILAICFMLTLNIYVLPLLTDMYSARSMCNVINQILKPNDKLGYFSKTPSIIFYCRPEVFHVNESDVLFKKVLNKNENKNIQNIDINYKDNFVRKNVKINKSEIKFLDPLRKLKEFFIKNENAYVIILYEDYMKYFDELKVYKRGPIVGKYTYITNNK